MRLSKKGLRYSRRPTGSEKCTLPLNSCDSVFTMDRKSVMSHTVSELIDGCFCVVCNTMYRKKEEEN